MPSKTSPNYPLPKLLPIPLHLVALSSNIESVTHFLDRTVVISSIGFGGGVVCCCHCPAYPCTDEHDGDERYEDWYCDNPETYDCSAA